MTKLHLCAGMSASDPDIWPDLPEWQSRSDAALTWVRRSIAVTNGQGSAHSYSPIWGWARAYPETTGYLIETLLQYAKLKQDSTLRDLAFNCASWLCHIQLLSGAFPGLTAGHAHPSVFNSSQILFGLNKIDKEILTEENYSLKNIQDKSRQALNRALDWLLSVLEPDGVWRQAAYVPGFVPAYYTRAVWGVLRAGEQVRREGVRERMRQALRYYALRFQPDGTVRDWGFRPGPWAFTHTIAYTLEGFLESALLLDEKDILAQTIRTARAFQALRAQAGRTAGRYGAGWRGDYSFRCLSGNAQLSVLFSRLWEVTGEAKFRNTAQTLLREILGYQKLGRNPNTFGALPGSAPIWGPYLRFRYPNWGVKFFLDALAKFDTFGLPEQV